MRRHTLGLPALALLALGCAASTTAAQAPEERAQLLVGLSVCRAIEDDMRRLQCFDQFADQFEAAEESGEIVVLDREQVRGARRALFGFSLPSVALFPREGAPEQIDSVESALVQARQVPPGRWVFTLANQSVWRQIDSEILRGQPRPGAPVTIRRGAIGSYLLSVDGARSLRVRREQ